MFKLSNVYELLMPWICVDFMNLRLTDLVLDSREVQLGNLFIAIKGNKTDGRLYIDAAIKNGAIAVLSESNNEVISVENICSLNRIVPVIYFNQLNRYISNIAGRFYGYPSLDLHIIGVTGTNGKTTISHLLMNWVELLGEKSATIGTLGYGVLNNICPHASDCTTCSAVDTQRILAQFVQDKVKFVSIEISSHGLDQYRVDSLYFDVAIFSNLSYDHIDYHSDIKQYEAAKWRLFNELYVKHYVINIDDDIGYQWITNLTTAVAVTMTNKVPKSWTGKWICLIKAYYHIFGTDIVFNSSWGKGIIKSQLLGPFNISNLLLALGALLVMGYPLELLLNTVSRLKSISGRLEVFRLYNSSTVIVDYAHTPDALKKVLFFIKQFCRGKLWCVFGCGGDRDRVKRTLMGDIAEKYSDYVIITNDNPRTEDPRSIINDIICNIKNSKKIQIIEDRIRAINTVMSQVGSEDFVLIFGKGHEKYQIIQNDRISYSDQDIVKKILSDYV